MVMIIGSLVLVVAMTGCMKTSLGDNKNTEIDSVMEQQINSEEKVDYERPVDYTLRVSENKVSLFDWEDETDLDVIFGERIFQETTELVNADTFTGSFIRIIKYDDTEVKLFSPKGDGERFYILGISSTNEGLITNRGIKIGDSTDLVKEAYPEVEGSMDGTTGRDGKYQFMFNYDAYTYITFVIKDGVVTEINLYHEFA